MYTAFPRPAVFGHDPNLAGSTAMARPSHRRSQSAASLPIYTGNEGDLSPAPLLPQLPSEKKVEKKTEKHKFRTLEAELKMAMGAAALLKEKRRESAGRGGQNNMVETLETGVMTLLETGGAGLAQNMLATRHAPLQPSFAQPHAGPPAPSRTLTLQQRSAQLLSGFDFSKIEATALSTAKELAGPAAAMAVVGGADALLQHYEKEKKAKKAQSRSGSLVAPQPIRPGQPSFLPRPPVAQPSQTLAMPSRQLTVPRSLSAPPVQAKTFLSELSDREHHLVQHAAVVFLLREPEMKKTIGSFEHIVLMLETSVHNPRAKRNKALFGVPLKTLVRYESVDSHHGIGPHTVRIPTFIDHIITALMQADVTIQGILRKSTNLHQLGNIIAALDNADGNDTVIDLAALDPITLANLFKKFLSALPDPVLSGHLFKLFIATSHIKNVALRKRCMHFVLCLMPKANRDVMECIFLFLDWLSSFAHINVRDGNEMDFTAISKIMAPTLLRPLHRDPRVNEVPAMIAVVLNLLEDQHILHEVPLELARVVHFEQPKAQAHKKDSAGLLHWLHQHL